MTVRNGAAHLEEAIQSVFNQSIDNWELVVLDDGSSDATGEILSWLAGSDSRIIVLASSGIGRGAALNRALESCRSDILSNLDADDLAHPKRAEILSQAFDNNKDFGAISGKALVFCDGKYFQWPNEDSRYKPHDVTTRLVASNPVNHSAVGVSREAIEAVGGYDESRLSQFDYDLWVRMAEKGYRIGKVNAVLGAKRIHPEQSYERRSHLTYAWRSAQVRWRAVKVLNTSPVIGALSVAALLAWAFLPSTIRMGARRLPQRLFGIGKRNHPGSSPW
ncbi:glycosyltransferase [Halorhodospira halochloris]|uniref:glycosyltransferase family 2 protein n=1 Tax=Halorhodospira halochloris TaxID=1052 RepID=UPI001EE83175|nr:glycosyltransferase [Halorhodospira halochloris]MCG5531208.1 glycosyltransferase [Halorhodospira halochloris]